MNDVKAQIWDRNAVRPQKRFNRKTQESPEPVRKVTRKHEAKPGARGAHLQLIHAVGPQDAAARDHLGASIAEPGAQDYRRCAVAEQDTSDDVGR